MPEDAQGVAEHAGLSRHGRQYALRHLVRHAPEGATRSLSCGHPGWSPVTGTACPTARVSRLWTRYTCTTSMSPVRMGRDGLGQSHVGARLERASRQAGPSSCDAAAAGSGAGGRPTHRPRPGTYQRQVAWLRTTAPGRPAAPADVRSLADQDEIDLVIVPAGTGVPVLLQRLALVLLEERETPGHSGLEHHDQRRGGR